MRSRDSQEWRGFGLGSVLRARCQTFSSSRSGIRRLLQSKSGDLVFKSIVFILTPIARMPKRGGRQGNDRIDEVRKTATEAGMGCRAGGVGERGVMRFWGVVRHADACSTLEPQTKPRSGNLPLHQGALHFTPMGRAGCRSTETHGRCASPPRCAYRTPPPVPAAAQQLPSISRRTRNPISAVEAAM